MAQNLYSVEKQAKLQAAKTILVIEDDLHVGYVLAQALKEEFSSKVIFATDALQALKMIRLVLPDLRDSRNINYPGWLVRDTRCLQTIFQRR